MGLKVLADRIGVSTSFLSMAERGQRSLDRRSYLHDIADVLEVSLADLTGRPNLTSTPRTVSEAAAAVPALRLAVMNMSLEEPPDAPPRPLAAVVDDLRSLGRLRATADLGAIGRILPPAITDLTIIAATSANRDERASALRHLVQSGYAAFALLKALGYPDLAWIAAERTWEMAESLGEPAWMGVADNARCHGLVAAKTRLRARSLALQSVARLEPHVGTNPGAAEMYGMMHLSAALCDATLRQATDIESHFAEADDVARRTGEASWDPLHTGFGPTNVGIWRMAINLELGDPGSAIASSERVEAGKIVPFRRASYYADLGRALAHDRKRQRQAVEALRRAERLAPTLTHANPMVRDAVQVMLNRATAVAGGRDLRGLAYRMGIPHELSA